MSHKITTLTIQVPYKSAGSVIRQHEVSFDVYRVDGHYSLRPCLDAAELSVANLPQELNFVMENGKPVSLWGKHDGNFHVIQDAVEVLRAQQQLE